MMETIICIDSETDMLITVFEENQTADPTTDMTTLLAQVMYVALKHFLVHSRATYYSVTKTSYASHAVKSQ